MNMYILIAFSALLNGAAQILWKYGLTSEDAGQPISLLRKCLDLSMNAYFMGGFFLYVISILLWIFVISKVEVSFAYPILSLSYIVVMIGGYFLGEHISLGKVLGGGLILLGIFFIART